MERSILETNLRSAARENFRLYFESYPLSRAGEPQGNEFPFAVCSDGNYDLTDEAMIALENPGLPL